MEDNEELKAVTYSTQLKKAHLQLKQLDSEMMENINIILASLPQMSLTAHAQATLNGLRTRREELFKLMHFLGEEINANRDAANAGVPVDPHYL